MNSTSSAKIISFDFREFVIRPLTADDSQKYRKLRQDILDLGDGKYFNSSYEIEKQFVTQKQWQEWCTESPEHCIIGTFFNVELVGIMAISQYGQKVDLTAEWGSTWLDSKYRKYGLAKLAYIKVWEWTVVHGYHRAIVDIKDGNERSLQIRMQQGAVYSHTKKNEVWADGSIADAHYFILDLYRTERNLANAYANATKHLQTTLDDLNDGEASAGVEGPLKTGTL